MCRRSGSKEGQRGKKEKWKRLNTATKCIIKSEKRKTWEKSVLDLQEDYKGNKKLLYAMRNKMEPKSELCSILDTNRKLV
jgi:hypothetical protein